MGRIPTSDSTVSAETRVSFRNRMPISRKWAYFDHAAVAPLPQNSCEAIQRWLEEATFEGDTRWLRWAGELESLRAAIARLVHSQPAEIALVPNTSTGISIVSEGLDWKPGDNVLFPSNEFPSNSLPWQHLRSRGVEVRTIRVNEHGAIDLSHLSSLIDSRTRLVAASWVGFSTGYRSDLNEIGEIVHRHGALFFVDGIQGAGVFPIELADSPVDFFAADGHKWLLGPEGAGFLYIMAEHLSKLRPILVGWGSVQNASEFKSVEYSSAQTSWQESLPWKAGSNRFEVGSMNMVGMIGLRASVELFLELGADRADSPVSAAIQENMELLREGLLRRGAVLGDAPSPENRSGILSFEIPGRDPVEIRKVLMNRGVVTSVRNGKLRASTHAYNNQEDIDRLVLGWE